jgi:hypothetical protein
MSKQIENLRKTIREIVSEIVEEKKKKLKKETTTTGMVAGYDTPKAFGKHDAAYVKRMAGLSGYDAVNESAYVAKKNVSDKDVKLVINDTDIPKYIKNPSQLLSKLNKAGFKLGSGHEEIEFYKNGNGGYTFRGTTFIGAPTQQIDFKKSNLKENRYQKLRKENAPPNRKIGVGIREIRRKVDEIEKFLEWYGKIKNENSLRGEQFWKRTNRHIYRIKERLQGIRKNISYLKK